MSGAPLVPGYRIARYELVHQLGRGAIGETFKARVVEGARADQLVCLKVLAQEFRGGRSAERDAALRYLRHEARVVSQLDHPNIARLLDSGAFADAYYLAFELVEGVNVGDVLAHGTLGADHVMHLALELSKALACAHERDVLHRDIKPSNILIGTAGEVKLVDFGLAKLNVGSASQFSQHVGTPRYFSPEQLRSEALTPATDIYAVGLVLFELLTSAHPFHSADVDVFRGNVIKGAPQKTLRNMGFPRELVAIIERCIELDPSKRFRDGTELSEALRAAADDWSAVGEGDLRELSALNALGGGPDSQAVTRLGDVAARTADIRDEPSDFPTKVGAGPGQARREVTRAAADADPAEASAATLAFEAESIRGELSRIVQSVAEHQSNGLEPAQANRSGVRPADEPTPLLRRQRARATADGQRPLATSAASMGREGPQQSIAAAASRPWMQRRYLLTLALLLAAMAAAFVLLRPQSQTRAPSPHAEAARVTPRASGSSAPTTPSTAAQSPEGPAVAAVRTQEPVSQAATPTKEHVEASVLPSPKRQPSEPSKTQPTESRASASRANARELVTVTIGTIPYGEVIIDGRRAGTAPLVVKLAPGPHRIVGRAQQLRRAETVVVSQETNQVVLDLRGDHAAP